MRDQVSNHTFREALRGNLDLASLPLELATQIRVAQARMQRRYDRFMKRETKAQAYATVGLNGSRAVLRRQRQIAAGSLRAENGLDTPGAWTAAQFGKIEVAAQ